MLEYFWFAGFLLAKNSFILWIFRASKFKIFFNHGECYVLNYTILWHLGASKIQIIFNHGEITAIEICRFWNDLNWICGWLRKCPWISWKLIVFRKLSSNVLEIVWPLSSRRPKVSEKSWNVFKFQFWNVMATLQVKEREETLDIPLKGITRIQTD